MRQQLPFSTLIFLLLGTLLAVEAQELPHKRSYKGKVMLKDQSIVEGIIKYNMQTNIIELQSSGKLYIYTARQAIHFEIYDSLINKHRKMYSLPYALSASSYQSPIFFELLQEGKITLLCREGMAYQTSMVSPYFSDYTSYLVLVYNYFILNKDADIVPIIKKKATWMELMADRKDEITQFLKDNQLYFHTKSDLSKMVAFYNSFYEK